MQRRSVLIGSALGAAGLAASAAAGSLLWTPAASAKAAQNTGHNAYFAALNALLKQEGPGRPVLLLDTQRMQGNIDLLAQSVGPRKTYRVVVKSLPSVALLREVMQRAKTNALMVFHQPFLNAIADAFPESEVLIGKPFPVAAVNEFYRKLGHSRFDPATQVQWLADSKERLAQYQQLAKSLGVRMRINFEIDVGLHRGGLRAPAELEAALQTIASDSEHLSFSGLMGYEAHLTGLGASLDHPAVASVLNIYQGFVDTARSAGYDPAQLTLNGAGSHTLPIYRRDQLMNDLAAGSGVVKPTDFDTHHLQTHRPALFIATPILKRYEGNPFAARAPDPLPAEMARLYYIYGGYWKADMVSPPHIGKPIYQSTNQSPITTASNVDLQVDDYMFLRPTQSEFVMLQFGDLLTVNDGELGARWPVFAQTG